MDFVEDVAESNSNRVNLSDVADFVDGAEPSEKEVEHFLNGLVEAGFITKKAYDKPVYNFFALDSERPFSGDPEFVKSVFDEVEREAAYIEMQYGQKTISDYSNE